MISFSSISIRNFRLYSKVDVNFDSDNGVYLMSGDNGAGKSTFLNAINWCLYGDTPFYSVQRYVDVVSVKASEETTASVDLYVTIDNAKYAFRRETRKNLSPSGTFSVKREKDGNWKPLDSIESIDAVRRILPKEIRHLFFFNGEQLKDIYSDNGKDHNLRDNVYKVSEIDIIDNAIIHFAELEKNYLYQISKSNKNARKIEDLQDDIDQIRSAISGSQELVDEYTDGIRKAKEEINKLDKIIEKTKDARVLLEQRDDLKARIEKLKGDIDTQELNKQDCLLKNFHRVIMHERFAKYRKVLNDAKEKNLIPPPVDPKITHDILESGVCMCGREIMDAERRYIEKQHEEYSRRQELQYLTDGIHRYAEVETLLPEIRYSYLDILKKLQELNGDKNSLSEKLKKVQDQLGFVDEANIPDNPEFTRDRLEKTVERNTSLRVNAADNKIKKEAELKTKERDLAKAIGQDTESAEIERKRKKASSIQKNLQLVKERMEKNIRDKLKTKTWDIFSRILPDTEFASVEIGESYTISLKSKDDKIYSVGMLSTGQAKALGLSLVHALSVDLGYKNVPLLIDNLYGDIKETHFSEITKMISSLSSDKQIVIMDLDIRRVESEFKADDVKKRFQIEKRGEDVEIKELANEY